MFPLLLILRGGSRLWIHPRIHHDWHNDSSSQSGLWGLWGVWMSPVDIDNLFHRFRASVRQPNQQNPKAQRQGNPRGNAPKPLKVPTTAKATGGAIL